MLENFTKGFFLFLFFCNKNPTKTKHKSWAWERQKQKKKKRNAHPPNHPPLWRQGLCVCVRVCVCRVHYCYRYVFVGGSQIPHTQIRCCCCCKWVVASPGCCNTCYGPRGCSRLLCLQRFDTSVACYFELTIPCALTRTHTHKKRETQKAT
jgi:hypothetical protein